MSDLPRYADTVVVGGGTAGPVVAARLSQRTGQTVMLIEAGPDYGPFEAGGWPAELLDPFQIPISHDWNYTSAAKTGKPSQPLERARVMGGCSAHNGCAAVWGSSADYDAWRDAGNIGWSADDLAPLFEQVSAQMCVQRLSLDEVSPWHRAYAATALDQGQPWLDDFNALEGGAGVGMVPANIHAGARWNAAFAYLDPARRQPGLTILPHTLVDRLRLEGGRVRGIEVLGADGPGYIEAGRVVLCGGAYGSPAILLRSGIGPADELRALGVAVAQDLPGVGRNLHDHPAIYLQYSGTPAAAEALTAFCQRGGQLYVLPVIAKLRSAGSGAPFDLHVFPMCWPAESGGWEFVISVANVAPRARGNVRLASLDPRAAPIIDTRFLDDASGDDARVLWEGVKLTREWAQQPALAEWCGDELPATAVLDGPAALRRASAHYFHPVGTCSMGTDPTAGAVVDAHGRVYGWDNLYVADAALMPAVPRGNTNLPTLVVAERVASGLGAAAC